MIKSSYIFVTINLFSNQAQILARKTPKRMSKEMFNPSDPKYKKVKDLPKEERDNYTNVAGGFVTNEAAAEMADAQKIVALANHLKKAGIDVKAVLNIRTKDGLFQEAEKALKENKTPMDILRERAVEKKLKSTDALHHKANELHLRLHPESSYLEKLKKNELDLSFGIPRDVWANEQFILEAVKHSPIALRKIQCRMKREYVLEAVKHYPSALQYALDEYRNDKDIVLTAVKKDANAIKYASRSIKAELRDLLKDNTS